MAPAGTIALALLALTGEPAPERGSARSRPGGTSLALTGEPAPADASRPAATRISVAILRADGFDDLAELERAIRLRLPGLSLVAAGDAAPPADAGSLRAFIELRRVDVQVQLTLILADGRAYLRELEVDADDAARPAASALANLVAAIEDDTAVPDKQDVPLPPALVEPTPEPVPKDIPPAVPAPTPVRPAPAPVLPRWELGPLLRVGGALGLSPPQTGLRGAGAALGLDARAPSGLLLSLDLQWLTRAVDRYHLQRIRVAVGVGYALRRGGFELPVAVMFGVEPWWLSQRGHRVPLSSTAGPPGPLLGLGLRLSPGYSAPVGRSGARLRVGARVELWGSGVASDGLRRPELRLPNDLAGPPVPGSAPTPGTVTGLGGAELLFGVEVGVWLPAGPGVKPRSRRTGP